MPVNFFKITFRNLWKNRGYSFLNIFGLAIGVACAGLIFLWVENELSYDQFLVNKDRLYYIKTNQTYDGKTRTFDATPVPLAVALSREVPGITAASRVYNSKVLLGQGDKTLYEDGAYADSSFFDLFSISFVEGNARDALRSYSGIVITEKVAGQFFGKDAAVGKILRMDNKEEYRVSGVIRDFPDNSKVHPAWIVSFQKYYRDNDGGGNMDKWGNNSTDTYIMLAAGADGAAVQRKIYDFIQTKDKTAIAKCVMQSANDWHLRDRYEDGKQAGGTIEYVRLFVVIAWIVLLIACINFMNLATARSDKRSKEVGVRKVLGAGRRGLIGQFIGESMVLSALADLLCALLITLALPSFSVLIGRPLQLQLTEPVHLGALAAIAVICGLVAGSYPALYLSGFNPIFVFKGMRMSGSGAALIRKGLVVLQFTISVILIISTVIIYRQIEHVRHRDLGYDMNQLIAIPVRGEMAKHFATISQDLLSTGVVDHAALNTYNTLDGGYNGSGMKWEGKRADQDPLISYRGVSPGFLATAGMKLVEGRDFRQDNPAADSLHVMVTETLAKMMGRGSAIGKQIWWDDNQRLSVVGVVKDYVFGNMYGQPDPVLIFCSPDNGQNLFVRIKAGVRPEVAEAKIGAVIRKDNPAYPFDYTFVRDDFNAKFKTEALIGQLSQLFAVLAILISCLGLFGLSAYMAERRVKEIGIRKVLGASVAGLTGLLSREFLRLVMASTLIAFPVAWLIMHHWLQQYAYRIGIEWWIFLAAGGVAVVIALVTVSVQSVRAALMNPVRSLRSE
jgi:putative ABC transport system permease protein